MDWREERGSIGGGGGGGGGGVDGGEIDGYVESWLMGQALWEGRYLMGVV